MKKIIGLFLLIWAIGSAQVSAQSETNRLEEFYKLKYCSTVVYMVPRA